MSIKSTKKRQKSDYQITENTSLRHRHHNQNCFLHSPRLSLPACFSLLLSHRPPRSPSRFPSILDTLVRRLTRIMGRLYQVLPPIRIKNHL